MDLASARDVKLLGIDAKILADMKNQSGLLNDQGGHLSKQDKDVDVIAYATAIIAACDPPGHDLK